MHLQLYALSHGAKCAATFRFTTRTEAFFPNEEFRELLKYRLTVTLRDAVYKSPAVGMSSKGRDNPWSFFYDRHGREVFDG